MALTTWHSQGGGRPRTYTLCSCFFIHHPTLFGATSWMLMFHILWIICGFLCILQSPHHIYDQDLFSLTFTSPPWQLQNMFLSPARCLASPGVQHHHLLDPAPSPTIPLTPTTLMYLTYSAQCSQSLSDSPPVNIYHSSQYLPTTSPPPL